MAHDHLNLEHDPHSFAADFELMLQQGANRRQSLRWLLAAGGATVVPLVGCGGGSGSSGTSSTAVATTATATATTGTTSSTASTSTSTSTSTTSTSSETSTCAVIPEETGGPYPADGTNSNGSGTVSVLTLSGIVRSDITTSIGSASGTAAGVPLTIKLKLVNASASCASLAGYVVYLWHCTRDGLYSLYSTGVTNQNYLRGVQAADADGYVTFTTIFPGCYSGRMTHIHLEVYPSLASATSAANRIKTTQFTFPLATLNQVYAVSGYSASVTNLAQISYATDNVFSDGTALQMATVSGNTSDGYTASLQVGVAA